MSEWTIANPINYSANGDDVDQLTLKTKLTFEQIFQYLNQLKVTNAESGLNVTDDSAYQLRVNTQDNCLYIRDKNNASWICLGEIAENFGITADAIGAMTNGGGVGKITLGLDADKPTSGNDTNDIYIARDTYTWYCWNGRTWLVILSLNFKDLLGYADYVVQKSEVGYNGANKVLRLDEETGKGNIDITGSPDRLLNYQIETTATPNDGDVFVFNATTQKFELKPNYIFTEDDTTYQNDAGKLLKVSRDQKIHVDVEGSASKIDNLPVVSSGIRNGQVLIYENGRLIPADKDVFTEDDTTTTGETGKLVKVETDGKIHGSFYLDDTQATYKGEAGKFVKVTEDGYIQGLFKFDRSQVTTKGESDKLVKVNEDGEIVGTFNGKTTQIGDIKLQITNLKDGDVFVYHSSTQTIKNEPKNAVGQGKSLTLKDGDKVLGDYNGAENIVVDVSSVIAKSNASYVNHLLRLVENLYLTLVIAELDPGGYDQMHLTAFTENNQDDIEMLDVKVISIVKDDDSLDVETTDGLVEGAFYQLVDENYSYEVQIKTIKVVGNINRVILSEPVAVQFSLTNTYLRRSNVNLINGKLRGKNILFLTKPVTCAYKIKRAHLIIKHQLKGVENIKAEISLRSATSTTEKFKVMTKGLTYPDQHNPKRGTTEFTFISTCTCEGDCKCGGNGNIAVLRITAAGKPIVIDSFACVFNE